MSDNKLLQAIIDGQRALKEELKDEIKGARKDIKLLDEKVDRSVKELTERLDKIGKQVAVLDDDAPSRDEFDDHEARIKKLESQVSEN